MQLVRDPVALLPGGLTADAQADPLFEPQVLQEDHDLVGDLLGYRRIIIGIEPGRAAHEVQQADWPARDPERDADQAVEACRRDDRVLDADQARVCRQVVRDQGPVLAEDIRQPDVLDADDVALPGQDR